MTALEPSVHWRVPVPEEVLALIFFSLSLANGGKKQGKLQSKDPEEVLALVLFF